MKTGTFFKIAPLVGTAFLTMAVTMPSCPGQQAMQQQIDTLQSTVTRLNTQVMSMDSQVKSLSSDNVQLKELMEKVVTSQQGAINQMNASIKDLDQKVNLAVARMSSSAKGKGKPAPKRKRSSS